MSRLSRDPTAMFILGGPRESRVMTIAKSLGKYYNSINKQKDHDGPVLSWQAAGASQLNMRFNQTWATLH